MAAQGPSAPASPDRNAGHCAWAVAVEKPRLVRTVVIFGGKVSPGASRRIANTRGIAPVLTSCFPPVFKLITRHFLAIVVHKDITGVCNLDAEPELKELSEPWRQYAPPVPERQQQSFASVLPKSTGLLGFS
jgi:hypothetical protein